MGNEFYIFGAGRNGRKLLSELRSKGITVIAFIDNDKGKQDMSVDGLVCIGAEEAVKRGAQESIILISPENDGPIREQLEKMGFGRLISMKQWLRWLDRRAYFEPEIIEATDYMHVVPFNHYESPYPDIREIHQKEKQVFDTQKEILDIDFNVNGQKKLLDCMKDLEMPGWADEESEVGSNRYYYHNSWFAKGSADALYYMIRILKPQNIIEVGSGFSTAVILDTNEKFMNHSVRITSIEPNPQRLISLLRPNDNIEIYEKNLQEIPVAFFERLKKDDILFIDSSHVAKTNSDVNYILFEILPRLSEGVYIHFHDIIYPFIYPKEWVYEGRAYNEAYMLRAFLMNNEKYSVQLFGEMLLHTNRDKVPSCLKGCGCGSLWIKKEKK